MRCDAIGQCGKSSIIRTFLHDGEFQSQVVTTIPDVSKTDSASGLTFRISDASGMLPLVCCACDTPSHITVCTTLDRPLDRSMARNMITDKEKSKIAQLIRSVDVVCIVYDESKYVSGRESTHCLLYALHARFLRVCMFRPACRAALADNWLPYVESIRPHVPVIIVGSKHDVAHQGKRDITEFRQQMQPLLVKYRVCNVNRTH
jgi:GTPase SAR1 family protein